MPPCGYRSAAIKGMSEFLSDNVEYFVELYEDKTLNVQSAIEIELCEIDRIKADRHNGAWHTAVVEINRLFYLALKERIGLSWGDVRAVGHSIIDDVVSDLQKM